VCEICKAHGLQILHNARSVALWILLLILALDFALDFAFWVWGIPSK
jgi:TM2 domain-containing membrane protein YozV